MLNWTVWWEQTRPHEGFPGPVGSFKGRLGSPSAELWLRPDPGCLDGYGPGEAAVSVALSSRGVSEPSSGQDPCS